MALTGQDARSVETDRAHLEANMASALLLQSPREYRRWLLTYVRHLSQSEPQCLFRLKMQDLSSAVSKYSFSLSLQQVLASNVDLGYPQAGRA